MTELQSDISCMYLVYIWTILKLFYIQIHFATKQV